MKTQQVQLRSTPQAYPEEQHFQLAEIELVPPAAGEVLCETLYLSLDPYMRGQISGRHISGSVQPGQGMLGETVSRVLESRSDAFKQGQLVRVMGGWQAHSVHPAAELSPLPEGPLKPSYYLSALGMPGLTAYAGLIWQARPATGDTVLIPAATGGVGGLAGQLAKSAGCRVIGIAGGPEKCAMAIDALGYDACIDRHAQDVAAELDRMSPEGVDVYFDLVGGELLHRVSERLKPGARVVLCGMIAESNNSERLPGPPPALWIIARATVYGLVVYDFESRRQEFINAVQPRIESGEFQVLEDECLGLEQAAGLFCRMMRGENRGKAIVRINNWE